MNKQIEKLNKRFEDAAIQTFFSDIGAVPPEFYDLTDKTDIISISIFPEAWGKKWNTDILNILCGFKPSLIRVCEVGDSKPHVNRITVWIDSNIIIQRIEKEVMVRIRENRKHGQDVKSRAMNNKEK